LLIDFLQLQTMAYPATKDPRTFALIFFTNLLSNYTNLVFLFNWWFRFRIWIKVRSSSIGCLHRFFFFVLVYFWFIFAGPSEERVHMQLLPDASASAARRIR
jgi:hypothetical protein